jgi:rod shape-determining protein MreD
MKGQLTFAILLAVIASVLMSSIFHKITLIPFAPTLAILYLKTNFKTSLWLSCIFGVFMDILSSSHFGFYSLNYTVATALIYRYKRFFDEGLLNFSIFTILISCIITITAQMLHPIFSPSATISFSSLLSDIIIMPLIDGIYAIVWFYIPIKLYRAIQWNVSRFARLRKRR